MPPPTAIVIGAGIGGLASGIALKRRGWIVRVYERASEARELGFGLGLAPNALAALRELGVADAVTQAGAAVGGVDVRRASGKLIRRFSLPVAVPAVVALRPVLHGALLDALGTDALHLDHAASTIVDDGQRVRVTFADGTLRDPHSALRTS